MCIRDRSSTARFFKPLFPFAFWRGGTGSTRTRREQGPTGFGTAGWREGGPKGCVANGRAGLPSARRCAKARRRSAPAPPPSVRRAGRGLAGGMRGGNPTVCPQSVRGPARGQPTGRRPFPAGRLGTRRKGGGLLASPRLAGEGGPSARLPLRRVAGGGLWGKARPAAPEKALCKKRENVAPPPRGRGDGKGCPPGAEGLFSGSPIGAKDKRGAGIARPPCRSSVRVVTAAAKRRRCPPV